MEVSFPVNKRLIAAAVGTVDLFAYILGERKSEIFGYISNTLQEVTCKNIRIKCHLTEFFTTELRWDFSYHFKSLIKVKADSDKSFVSTAVHALRMALKIYSNDYNSIWSKTLNWNDVTWGLVLPNLN